MGRGGFLNKSGSRGHGSLWLGAGATPLLRDEATQTLENSSICEMNLWPLLTSYKSLVLLFV